MMVGRQWWCQPGAGYWSWPGLGEKRQKARPGGGPSAVVGPGVDPGTPRFSGECSSN